MELRKYLRAIINNKVRPLFIKEKCEVCEEAEDLILHHVTLFSDIVNSVLEDLKLELKEDTHDYTEKELRMIVTMVLGKHLEIDYLTVCQECHKEIHKDSNYRFLPRKKYKIAKKLEEEMKKEIERNYTIENILLPYINNNINKKLFSDSQEELSEILSKIVTLDYRTKKVKLTTLRNIICNELKLPFIIGETRNETRGELKGRRYIIISKII